MQEEVRLCRRKRPLEHRQEDFHCRSGSAVPGGRGERLGKLKNLSARSLNVWTGREMGGKRRVLSMGIDLGVLR